MSCNVAAIACALFFVSCLPLFSSFGRAAAKERATSNNNSGSSSFGQGRGCCWTSALTGRKKKERNKDEELGRNKRGASFWPRAPQKFFVHSITGRRRGKKKGNRDNSGNKMQRMRSTLDSSFDWASLKITQSYF